MVEINAVVVQSVAVQSVAQKVSQKVSTKGSAIGFHRTPGSDPGVEVLDFHEERRV